MRAFEMHITARQEEILLRPAELPMLALCRKPLLQDLQEDIPRDELVVLNVCVGKKVESQADLLTSLLEGPTSAPKDSPRRKLSILRCIP